MFLLRCVAGAEVDKVRCTRCGRCTATLVPFKSLAIAMTQEAQEESCQHASAWKLVGETCVAASWVQRSLPASILCDALREVLRA